MHTRTRFPLPLAALTAGIALFALACGNDPDRTEGDGTGHDTDGTSGTSSTVEGTSASPHGTVGATDPDRTAVATYDTTLIHIHPSATGKPQYDERYVASKDIRGYRALLMAELEAIRTRLNDGTRPVEAAKKDQERAADLAQGLERMDRLILAIEESDDVTWTSIRTSQLKEAAEVRVWASEHGYRVG
jgi:hypothetical protein